MKKYYGIGLMSGTSLDGLDIAYVQFTLDQGWSYEILACETVPYDASLYTNLHECYEYRAHEFQKFHHKYGRCLGDTTHSFIQRHQAKPQYVASHGHTIFHEPQHGLTTQIGCGAQIYAATGLTTVCDFRTVDVALGGHGAPLVPKGDLELFASYKYLLNLGGIANITVVQKQAATLAFDITVANMALNHFAKKLGATYDANGDWAKSGQKHEPLLNRLNEHAFFTTPPPKSLGREFFEKEFLPIIHQVDLPIHDILHTLCIHIAYQISIATGGAAEPSPMIITGGGALNGFLVRCIKQACPHLEIVVPDQKTIEFKEALIFAFLGLLRLQNQPNSLASVTGAQHNAIGGAVYGEIPRL